MLKGAVMFGQSGGPTSVINSSAAGVFTEALKNQGIITKVYGAAHGIVGILNEDFYDMGQENPKELELLKYTPSSALGSVRYKLKAAEVDDKDYKRLLEVFKKYDIRYFFYNGGNDSMDTCNKVSKFMKQSGYEIRVIGVPKTIDNDLYGTDHCPGYGSAAKYIATTLMEMYLDAKVYETGRVCIVELMGRNPGWLTAASAIASYKGMGPDLIYLPENAFDIDAFLSDVKAVCDKNNNKCIVAVSEGIRDKDGRYIGEFKASSTDLFGHAQLGGVGSILAGMVKEKLGIKVRAVEFSIIQRCAAHLASKNDVEEAFAAGAAAVKYAIEGNTDKMVILKRADSKEYKCTAELMDLSLAANTEKKIPAEWILPAGKGMTQEFIDYALPLIQGDAKAPLEDGLPRFAKLKKVPARK
jgi:6-phosphofructokinase 1